MTNVGCENPNAIYTADPDRRAVAHHEAGHFHPIIATYSGDPNTLAGTSSMLQQSIVLYIGDFTIGVDPTSARLYTGESAVFRISVKSVNGFNQPLAMFCTSLPANATCGFSPASFANGQGSSVLTINTSAPHQVGATAQVSAPANRGPNSGTGRSLPAVFIAGIMLFVLPLRFRLRTWTLGLIAVCVLLGITSGSAPTPITGGTPPGSYQVADTAESSVPSLQLQHSAQVTLTVKSLF